MKNKGYITPNIMFPIIIISPDKTVSYLLGEEPITKVNKVVFEKKALLNTIIIDANAIKYKVHNVENLGYTNILGGLNIFFERTVYLKVELEKIKEIEFDKFKSLALKMISYNEDYYISSGMSIKHMKNLVIASTTTIEITSIITGTTLD